MNALIVDEMARAALVTLNAEGNPHRQLAPMELIDGRFALNADLLSDTGPDGTWHAYAALLTTLPQEEIAMEQFLMS